MDLSLFDPDWSCCDNCGGIHYIGVGAEERLDETETGHRFVSLLREVLASGDKLITKSQLARLYTGEAHRYKWANLAGQMYEERRLRPGGGHSDRELKQIVEELIYMCVFVAKRHEGKYGPVWYLELCEGLSHLPQPVIIHRFEENNFKSAVHPPIQV